MSKSKLSTGLSRLMTLFQKFSGASDNQVGPRATDGAAEVRLEGAFEGVNAVREVLAERNRLAHLAKEELQREEAIRRRIEQSDQQRIKAIADERVSGTSEESPALAEALAGRQRLEIEMTDCRKVAEDLRGRAAALEDDLDRAVRMYRGDLGFFLNRLYEKSAQRFNTAATEAADAAVDCLSVQKAMIRFLAGDPSGFEQRIFLPRAEPGNGKAIAPIIDSAGRDFDQRISARSNEIIELMREAGFSYRFDKAPL